MFIETGRERERERERECVYVCVFECMNICYSHVISHLKAASNYIETIRLMTLCNISVESPQIIELSLKVGKTLANKKE